LGLDSAGPWLIAAIKRLDCASSSLDLVALGSGAKLLVLAKSIEVFTFVQPVTFCLPPVCCASLSVQAVSSLRLPESNSGAGVAQAWWAVKNSGNLGESRFGPDFTRAFVISMIVEFVAGIGKMRGFLGCALRSNLGMTPSFAGGADV
jgi:hypothetical protein